MEKEVLIDEETIERRVTELAKEITYDYADEKLTLICILKGALYFYTDLSRRIDLDTEMEFIRVSSYEGENSTGKIELKQNLDEPVTNKNVIVVEDIIDTGHTMLYLLDYLEKQNPKSLKLCALLDKPERREVDINADYVGFTIPNHFVIGYGLDYDQKYRNLPEINCFVEENKKAQVAADREKIKLQVKRR